MSPGRHQHFLRSDKKIRNIKREYGNLRDLVHKKCHPKPQRRVTPYFRNLNELSNKLVGTKIDITKDWNLNKKDTFKWVQGVRGQWNPFQQIYRVPACIVNEVNTETKRHMPSSPRFIVAFIDATCSNDPEVNKICQFKIIVLESLERFQKSNHSFSIFTIF